MLRNLGLIKKRRAQIYIKINRTPKLLLFIDEHCKDTLIYLNMQYFLHHDCVI